MSKANQKAKLLYLRQEILLEETDESMYLQYSS